MERDVSVHIRETCEACGGTGEHRIEAGAGHVTWTRRVACEECKGTGQRDRWIPLGELRALLDAGSPPAP